MSMKLHRFTTLTGMVLLLIMFVGCGKTENSTNESGKEEKNIKNSSSAKKKDDHSTWWCSEHGIPEEECLVCKHSEAALKKMGDWCEKHEFAKSQCFKCDPTLKEKYAAKYRAKYGKEPPTNPE